VIWIGYLQWMHYNGFNPPTKPVLDPLNSIQCMDAIVNVDDPRTPIEPKWPATDFIVGNPPFLGGKLLRANLGEEYVDAIFKVWNGRVSRDADLCCYWFEKARAQIEAGRCERACLLATQGIRGGENRKVVERIKQTGDIYFAVSDRDWILDGANVHVSMIGFDSGDEKGRWLDGRCVAEIHANLTAHANVTQAKRLAANESLFLRPPEKGGKFEIDWETAVNMLDSPNPHGRPNSDVMRLWFNASMLVDGHEIIWIVDYPSDFDLDAASKYAAPFRYVEERVRASRSTNRYEGLRTKWWIYRRPGDELRQSQLHMQRLLMTPRHSKHRLFVWSNSVIQPDNAVYAFARDDDYFFGVLHSRAHEVWARAQGTQVRERESGFRYTPTTCFETFPFPEPTDEQREAIAAAAKELDTLRNNWLNPPEWTREQVLEFPGSADGPWARYVYEPDGRGIGTVRYPRIVPKDEDCAKRLAKRTLTNLYNERPTWLDLAHRRLDEAVFAAYGWDPSISDDELLAALLALNLARAAEGK
jgi:type II restriction/modification system DNA methylase subunit YeeA